MKLELLEVHPGDAAKAWELFPGSPMQRTLHNEVVRLATEARDKFETTKVEDLPRLQCEIAALRTLLGVIHRKDKLPTK